MHDTKTVEDFKQHGPFAQAGLYTHLNLDTEALILIATHYGLTSHAKAFEGIKLIHSEEGHMMKDLLSVRTRWIHHLRAWVHHNASAEDKNYLRGLI